MGVLSTVQEYVTEARILLQDEVTPYRYDDTELLSGLNLAIFEARRLRPDLYLSQFTTITTYSAVDTTTVVIDEQYRVAFLYYMLGHAQMRDEEDITDSRSRDFMLKFTAKLLSDQI